MRIYVDFAPSIYVDYDYVDLPLSGGTREIAYTYVMSSRTAKIAWKTDCSCFMACETRDRIFAYIRRVVRVLWHVRK